MHRLWSGGDHLHKEDVQALNSVTVAIRDKDGNLKQSGVPAIFTQPPTREAFQRALAETLRAKAAKSYDQRGLSHVDLVVLDWFHLPFDPKYYLTDQFVNDEMRQALHELPFREVFVIVEGSVEGADTVPAEDRGSPSGRWRIPLQQLLVMERAFATGHVIDEEQRESLRDVVQLDALMVAYVARVQGYGDPVLREGRLFLRYRATERKISADGLRVLDYQDFLTPEAEVAEGAERLDPETEARVAERARSQVFGPGYAEPANEPSSRAE